MRIILMFACLALLVTGCGRFYHLPGHNSHNITHPPPVTMKAGERCKAISSGITLLNVGFRRIYEGLPNIDILLMNPAKEPVPTDPAVLYALTGALATRSSKDNFDRVWEYVCRMPADFQVMMVCDATKLNPEIKNTKGFIKFASANSNLMV